ncbi:serine/threonine-protein kinase [Sorangium cellulosum]|uniref:Protein kinase domain-containing protein n=1 Tax=Sorangium cellulosum So0157-2 TaxID=1254432 RepID=S4Y4Y5_SORCE|nr:serine/threonine-protein kinase [Sorangium cellulosum]AGP40472.1 hypothetical protein SCE1572_41810 [Sorangium cellulosum So0157-2]
MSPEHEAELRVALTEGLVTRAEADALGEEARDLKRSPLALLVERGKLTEETLASLLAGALPSDATATATATATASAAVTAAPDAPAQSRRDRGVPSFPVKGWDRYEPLRFLGQGGMGMVFLARDARLHRDVALKFVRGDDARSRRRLIAEARAQARVSHERVCEVYEVGEVSGQVYIAMQHIDGVPLSALAGQLTVEQKARVLRDAALGVHEAHREGLIHRDLKPSNIMVEHSEEGELWPYVMDFGLARSSAGGTTETGDVLGTPHFMSPEQARGETSKLDRRADVYSLGATLYALLTGEPPFTGETTLEVLTRLVAEEPRPPRELDRDIPEDLEAITLKCLEKDRSARYDSARALADDLDRFLNGDAVAARATGAWYRLQKRLAKHRRAVAAAAVAGAVVLGALGFGLRARSEAAARERLARRFTEQVEQIESMARYSALSPLHDIRGDQAAIRAKMGELEAEIRRAGPIAVGPGNYALGRGYLALDDEDRALSALEAAWSHGFHEPRAAYALALVLGHRYREQLLETAAIKNKEQREAKRQEVRRLYRDPALAYLAQSAGADLPSKEYVAALVAFYEDRFDEALKQLDSLGGELPWFYEAPALRGDILVARAAQRWGHGDREGAVADFDAGRKAYAAAGAIGESSPAVLSAMGELEYAALYMELYGEGNVKPHFERGEEAVGRALAASPDRYASLVLEARLYRRFAEHVASRGGEVDALLGKAIAAAERAVAVEPTGLRARREIGRSYYQWGGYRQERGQDPRAELQKAIAIFETIGPEDRDYDDHTYAGLIFQVWADYEDQAGLDSLPNRGKSIEAYLAAIRLDDRQMPAWINLGATYFTRASQPRCRDPEGDLEQARSALDRARALNPKHVVSYFFLGGIHGLMAERKRARGGDARPDLTAALAQYREGLTINPAMPQLHNGAGIVLIGLAREAWDHGGDPAPFLDQALAAFNQAIAEAPEQGFGYHNVGEALVQRALYQSARGEDPGPTVREGIPVIQKAIDRIPQLAPPWANLGTLHTIHAEFQLTQARDPQASLAEATAALQQALRRNPSDAQSHRYLGEARATRARFLAGRGQARAVDFESAAEEFQKAMDLTPDDQDHRRAFGHFCRVWAEWQATEGRDPGPSLRRGLTLADQVLKARPEWPDARILRASLLLAEAQAAIRAGEQREEEGRAAEDFGKALAANPNLEHAWRRRATLAEQGAAR